MSRVAVGCMFAMLIGLAIGPRMAASGPPAGPVSINKFIFDLRKDGRLDHAAAEAGATEVARRLWWPDGTPLKVSSHSQVKSRTSRWTVTVHVDRPKASPGCEVVLSAGEGLVSVRFIEGA